MSTMQSIPTGSPRIISRKHRTVILRDERHEIYSLSIANLERLKQSINLLVQNFMKQAAAVPGLKWQAPQGKNILEMFKKSKSAPVPTETIAFINRLLETIFNEPVDLIQAASGLPVKFFDKNDPQNCLTIEELIEVGEETLDVNGLGFIVTALKELIGKTKGSFNLPAATNPMNQNQIEL